MQTSHNYDRDFLSPVEIRSQKQWKIKTPELSNDAVVIDNCILHSTTTGTLKSYHIPLIDNMRDACRTSLPDNSTIEYIIINGNKVKKSSRTARFKFMQSLKDWHRRFPFRMYIPYNANLFTRTTFNIAKPLMPFKIQIAKSLEHAFQIIQNDKKRSVPIKKIETDKKNNAIKQEDIENLTSLIGGLNWEVEGFKPSSNVSKEHPFFYLYQSIHLIKEELDDLFAERKLSEKSLHESEKIFKIVAEQSPNMLFINKMGPIVFHNKLCSEVLGYTSEEIYSPDFDFFTLIAPESLETIKSSFNSHINGANIEPREYTLLCKNGKRILTIINTKLIDYKGEKAILGVVTDISDLRKTEEELRQARKMESIGTLAGGVAHDFNNLLYMIVGNTELALEDIPQDSPAHESLEDIKSASLRAAGIVKQLLNFSRKADQKLKPINVIPVIKDALEFLRSTIPSTIKLKKQLPKNDVVILGDSIQINQVLMNIFTNASQEMEETGGTLEIKVEIVDLNQGEADDRYGVKVKKYLKITISDTGTGIPTENIDQIFDPYFTTKELGKGTGMGLSVVHGIIKNHNGTIEVSSQQGSGAVFTILFPVMDETPEIIKREVSEPPHGTETILFVDDEESIVNMNEKMLSRLGYKVKTRINPEEALDLFRTHPEMIDLVITDMTMPQMTGAKLAEKVKEIRPNIPIIVCTGHSNLINEEKFKQIGIDACIMKPASMLEIAKAIREALDK